MWSSANDPAARRTPPRPSMLEITVPNTGALVRILFLGLGALGLVGIFVIKYFRRRPLEAKAVAPGRMSALHR
jgi:hypothetical protein